jgi:hypothetical protein
MADAESAEMRHPSGPKEDAMISLARSRAALVALVALAALCLAPEAMSDSIIGLRPAITAEPEYPVGAFDLNLAPVCAELGPEGSALAFRLDLLFTLQVGGGPASIRNVGLLLGMPWYPFPAGAARRSGFFIGPKAGLSYNVAGGFWSTGPSVELGWSFDLGRVVVDACVEGGATVFLGPGGAARIGSHGGFSCIAGIRL